MVHLHGYVGYEEKSGGGILTKKVKQNPYSVVLFDEIEKAHSDIYNLLLQILDEGVLTDSSGRKIDFKNTIIVLTSNIGAKNITEKSKMGFWGHEGEDKDYEEIKKEVISEAKKNFKPEFINRLDEIIVFRKLSKDNINSITRKLLGELSDRLENKKIKLEYDESVVEFLTKTGFDANYGARPLKRAVQTYVEDLIAGEIINGKIKEGRKVIISVNDEKNGLKVVKTAKLA